jgi:quinol monooxygenase YgiN
MFERYTERARRVLFFARYEASQLGGSTIDSEHLLLGLLHEGAGVAFRLLRGAALNLDAARGVVSRATAAQPRVATHVEMPLSTRARLALERASDEANALKMAHIGAEHLLLGLLHESGTLTASMLADAGLTLTGTRTSIANGLGALVSRDPHVVFVQVTIRPEMAEEFEAALLHNARESVRRDPGCVRFDVSQDKEQPTRWILHEVYDGPDAHAAHRQAPHFLAYDAIAAKAVVEKTVLKCAGRHIT